MYQASSSTKSHRVPVAPQHHRAEYVVRSENGPSGSHEDSLIVEKGKRAFSIEADESDELASLSLAESASDSAAL